MQFGKLFANAPSNPSFDESVNFPALSGAATQALQRVTGNLRSMYRLLFNNNSPDFKVIEMQNVS